MSDKTAGMRCPVDGAQLVMSERSGIEIDYCPTCRGVWLDRGELDKIIERNAEAAAPPPRSGPAPQTEYGRDYDHGHDHGHRHDHRHGHGKRRKSFLEQIFD
jgi:Zn-finger nucleic acid-binding protein